MCKSGAELTNEPQLKQSLWQIMSHSLSIRINFAGEKQHFIAFATFQLIFCQYTFNTIIFLVIELLQAGVYTDVPRVPLAKLTN